MNNSKYMHFERYQISPKTKRSENKIITNDSISGSKSFGIHEAFFHKINQKQTTLVYYQPTKHNKYPKAMNGIHKAQNKFCTSLNKDFFNREHFFLRPQRTEVSISSEDHYNRTSINPKLTGLNFQLRNDNQFKENKNNKLNNEENGYPNNCSYYESKYTKKIKKEPETIKNCNTISTSVVYINSHDLKDNVFYKNKANNYSNTSINMNRSHEGNSPYKSNKPNSNYYKLKKDKINTLVNLSSQNNKKTRSIFNNNNNNKTIQPYSPSNYIYTKSSAQPHTPLNNNTISISSPAKKSADINYNFTQLITERVLPNKSIEKISLRKLVFHQPKNRNFIKFKRKIEISEGTETINMTEPDKDKILKTFSPKETKVKNIIKANTKKNGLCKDNNKDIVINNNKKDKVIITITNLKENKKTIRNLNYNNKSKDNSKFQPNNHIKPDTILATEKKKKKSIQVIKPKDINKKKKAYDSKTELTGKKNNKKNFIKKEDSINKKDENDYFKEVLNIMYDKNNTINNRKKYYHSNSHNINLSEGRPELFTKKFNNYTISYSKDDNYKNNRKYSCDAVLNNCIKFFNNGLEKKNSNSNTQTIEINIEKKKASFNKIFTPKIKKFKNITHSLNLINTPKEIKQNSHRYQPEISKYEIRSSRVNENPRRVNNRRMEIDYDWDRIQFMGMRKKTYDPSLRQGKRDRILKSEKNLLNDKFEFSSTIFVKSSEGLTIPGKNAHGKQKTNQDTYLIERNVNGVLNFNIFGVYDGHGDHGHFASQFVSRYIFHRIKNHPLIRKEDEPQKIYYKLIENGYRIIANIFMDADIQIQREKFDADRSGTTCVLVIQLEEHIICANAGDSRAIIIYDEHYDDNLMHSKVFPLSYDCKPELPNERKRILARGGIVERAYDPYYGETGPYRVWGRGEDAPGLAMSRSIGDMDAKRFGVIPNPQIVEYTIDYFTKYLIMASDGIWEFISNEQAMKLSNKYYLRNDCSSICHELAQRAISLWEKNDYVIDDITVLVVLF